MQRKYVSYSDPGHGWAKVKKSELVRLGISDKISCFSYMRGDYAYLEEDSDLTTFCEAKKARGEQFEFKTYNTNQVSKIRGYQSYHV